MLNFRGWGEGGGVQVSPVHPVDSRLDIVGLHLQIRLLFSHQYLNCTFNFPNSAKFAMLDDPDTNFTISPIDTSSLVATQIKIFKYK